MGQKVRRAKTAEELQTERVVAALEEIEKTGRTEKVVSESPGHFLRDMYEVWHRQGGLVGGRPRNSIRKMREQWLVGKSHVPSLHPKLMGRVKLTRSDVRALVDLFLTRWRYGEGGDLLSSMTTDGYVQFASVDRKQLRDKLLKLLLVSVSRGARGEVQLPLQENQPRGGAGDLRVESFIETEYRDCNALITFSRNRIAVGPNPPQIMKNFFYLFNSFFEEEANKRSSCIFIWIVDLGLRSFEENESFDNFYNASFLALLLHAFRTFDSKKDDQESEHGELFRHLRILEPAQRIKRWKWLCERSVVVADNLRLEEFQDLYDDEEDQRRRIRFKDAEIRSQNILPSEIPMGWISPLRKLTGRKIDINNISFTSLIKGDAVGAKGPRSNQVKYFAHARTINDLRDEDSNIIVDSLELPSPGGNYDDAFRMVHLASLYRLGDKRNFDSEEATAFAYLRHLGYQVLKIEDFMRVVHLS